MFYFNSIYTQNQIDKLGNAIIFLSERIKPLSKTKLLKLIYLIEESSVKKYGAPFFNLRFDVWKLGPVSRDLFVEISNEPALLEGYIKRDITDTGIFISPKKEFSDDEFNDLEIDLLEQIVKSFAYSTAEELINLTHRKHSPWYLAAQENGLLEPFEKGLASTSDVQIDFAKILEGDDYKMAVYESHKEFLNESRKLKF